MFNPKSVQHVPPCIKIRQKSMFHHRVWPKKLFVLKEILILNVMKITTKIQGFHPVTELGGTGGGHGPPQIPKKKKIRLYFFFLIPVPTIFFFFALVPPFFTLVPSLLSPANPKKNSIFYLDMELMI
jgi:hypothetical protein